MFRGLAPHLLGLLAVAQLVKTEEVTKMRLPPWVARRLMIVLLLLLLQLLSVLLLLVLLLLQVAIAYSGSLSFQV